MPQPRRGRALGLMLAAVCLVAINLRMTITGVGPLLDEIAADRGTTPAALGALVAIPLVTWGLVSPAAHSIAARWGAERAVGWSLVVLALGTVWRSIPEGSLGLWLGTALIGAALAISNVLMPAIIRSEFSTRIPLITGIYTALLGGFGAISSALVVPISESVVGGEPLGWRVALVATAAPIPLAIVVWIIATRRSPRRGHAASGAPRAVIVRGRVGRLIWRDAVAWSVALYMGLQSLSFYIIAAWLAPIRISQGSTAVEAGIEVAVYQVSGVLGSLALPLLYRGPLRRWLAALLPVGVATSFAAIVLHVGPLPLWLAIAGFGSGASLSISIMYLATKAREQTASSALSGMAQSVGYLIAATGPVIFGFAYELSGGWLAPLLVTLAFASAQLVLGIAVGRDRRVLEQHPEVGADAADSAAADSRRTANPDDPS